MTAWPIFKPLGLAGFLTGVNNTGDLMEAKTLLAELELGGL